MVNANEESVIKDAKKRILGDQSRITDETGSLLNQPLNEDWIELTASQYTYGSITIITVSEFDARNKFSIGDKLKLVQSATTKYFRVYDVSATSIYIYGGGDYTFTNNTITEIYFSKMANPIGFPNFFKDWGQLIVSQYTYVSAVRIAVSGFDARTRFSIGDRLWLVQAATTKYFYIRDVNASNIYVNGGTDYTFTNDAITEIYFSKFTAPLNFPATFNYDPDFRTPVVNQLSDLQSESYKFWMFGQIVYVDLHFDSADLAGGNSSIVADLPTGYSTDADVPLYACLGVNNFVPQTAIAKIGSSALFDLEILIVTDAGYGLWGASTNGVGVDLTLYYLIES